MGDKQIYQVKLEQFQGPLDLLLQLILEEKLDITEISLSKVAEQFIKYLEQVEELHPEELADFLVIATKLLLLKSRTLLPYLEQGLKDEGVNLTEQLKLYQEFQIASKQLAERLAARQFTYGRVDKYFSQPEPIFTPPKKITTTDLKDYFIDVLERLEPLIRLPQKALAKAVSLKEKIIHLSEHLEKQSKLSFKEVINTAKDKGEVIVTFLALLELVRQQTVSVYQAEPGADIMIEKLN